MKKLFLILICFISLQSQAQFLNSIGITAGVSAGNQKFHFKEPLSIDRKKYIVGGNASIFAEFFSHDHARWVTEFQFNQKGSIDKRGDIKYRNQLNYISWNNYLKLRYEMYSIIPYIMVGPRLDYNFSQKTQSPEITGKFLPLHLSIAVGGGVELVTYGNFKPFIEAFYNPDVMPAYINPVLHIPNKNFELRVGLKMEFGSQQSCNTPVYVE